MIFRRGPSRQVQLLRWNTATDAIEEGQWLKGRIYERRCDLSPDGGLLLYFAANYRPPYATWTAVSRPPYLTAIALWPKGDAWGGGGLFDTRSRIALNHREEQTALAEGFRVPKWVTVHPFGQYPGRGEDDPIWSTRLERDDWILASGGTVAAKERKANVWITLDPPLIWEKRHPLAADRYVLQMIVRGVREQNGPWYLTEHTVSAEPLGRTEWADWDASGDLLFSKGPLLCRVPFTRGRLAPLAEARVIRDFSDTAFEARESPVEARRWPKR